MCEFITAILPADIDKDKAAAIFARYHRGFEIIDNYRIAEHIDKSDLYILTTRGNCDCGTSLGNLTEDESPFPDEATQKKYEDEQIKKLKAKGWNDNKIRRKFEQEAVSRQEKKQPKEQGENKDIIRWKNLVSEFLISKTTPRISLLIHSYSTGVENERLPALGRQTIRLNELTTEVLTRTKRDVIYQFVAY